MGRNKILIGLGAWAMVALSPVAFAASATGTVSFDMTALSSTLQANSSNFSGWTFYSEVASTYGGRIDAASGALPNFDSSVAGASASTTAGSISTSAYAGGVSNAYQRVSATFDLASGKHLTYEIPYSLTLNQAVATQQLDVGLAFRVESSDIEFTVFRTKTTATSPGPGGPQTENSVLVIDLFNTKDVAQTYTIVGTLRADDFGPAGAVPEPTTYAMLLLGLGLVTLVVRSRKSAA